MFVMILLHPDTSSEYSILFGSTVNVQREVEFPEVYIVARCGSNDEQLAYITTRLEDLHDLKNGLNLGELDDMYQGIVLSDIMRFFHGDGPAVALEAGHQKGGHYFCPSCNIHACQTDDIACCYQQKIGTIVDKQNLVLRGKMGNINSLKGKVLPFEKLSVPELKQELESRNIDVKQFKNTLKDLQPILKKVLKGVKRVPILLMNHPENDLRLIGLDKYEILLIECMHDIAYHIDNVLVELPNHLKPEDKIKMMDVLSALNAVKEKKRCCDKRNFLVLLTKKTAFRDRWQGS